VKTGGEMKYRCRAKDHEGELLKNCRRHEGKATAVKFTSQIKRHGSLGKVTTDGLRSREALTDELRRRG
jgi:transposase-like protein